MQNEFENAFDDNEEQDPRSMAEEILGEPGQVSEEDDNILQQQADDIFRIKAEYEAASNAAKKLEKMYKNAQRAMIQTMQGMGLKSIHPQAGGRITVTEITDYKADTQKKVDYCLESGYEALLSVYYGTWNSHCKELAESGEGLPEWVEATPKTKLSVSKPK